MNARPSYRATSHRATRPRRTLRAAVVLGLVALVVSLTVQAGHSLSTAASPVPAGDTAGTGTGPVEDRPRHFAAAPVPGEDPARKIAESVDLKGLTLAQLQARAAQMQAEFIKASVAYEAAADRSRSARAAAEEAEAKAAVAVTEADAAGDLMGQQIEELYSDGVAANPMLAIITTNADHTVDDMYADAMTSDQILSYQSMTVETLDAERHQAEVLSAEATSLRATADQAAEETRVLLDDIQVRAARVASTANATLAATAGKGRFADAEQQARNKAALAAWQRYLKTLDKAHVVSPRAKALNRAELPYRLSPMKVDKVRVAGVASIRFRGKTVPVLPAETVAAVSGAFAQLGKPYVMGNAGPETFDCSGLTRAVWRTQGRRLGTDPAAQYEQVTRVPTRNAQIGDLVFFSDPAAGVQHVGINLGDRRMLAADGTSSQVGVVEYPGTPYAVGRVTLPRHGTHSAPGGSGGTVMRCGNEEVPASSAGMDFPMEKGTYRFTSQFGDVGGHWVTGFHTGLDFAAPIGSPVHAAKTGSVTVSKSAWGGPNLVTIDHGDGLTTLYAHMGYTHLITGDRVAAGQIIGTVGEEGNATGPHLHFEVRLAGQSMDPMLFLAGGGAAASGWGGFANGMIPASALCSPQSARSHRLRCDAAHAFDAMATAYAKQNGGRLCITDSYRSYALQVKTYAKKPVLGAVPGTSNHGWGLAVDLCGGIQSYSSPQHAWMVKYAGRFGWRQPAWAQQGGSKQEPWHWEFGRRS